MLKAIKTRKKTILFTFLTFLSIFLIIGVVSGIFYFSNHDEKHRVPIPLKTYIVDFENEGYPYMYTSAEDYYFPGDTLDIEIDITEKNVGQISLTITYRAASPLGDVDIEIIPPNSDIDLIIYKGEDRGNVHNYEFIACGPETSFNIAKTYEINASSIEEANILANQTYQMNETIGRWIFKASFLPGCLQYNIKRIEIEPYKYNIYVREKADDNSTS